MPRPFTSRDAKVLVETHDSLLRKLSHVIDYEEIQKKRIEYCAKNLLDSGVFAENVTKETVQYGVLSDAPSSELLPLIRGLYSYMLGEGLSDQAKLLGEAYRGELVRDMEMLAPATGDMRWFFTSGRKKQDAIAAYKRLSNAQVGEYGQRVNSLAQWLQQIEQADQQTIRQDFDHQKGVYFRTLLSILPDLRERGSQPQKFIRLAETHKELMQQVELVQMSKADTEKQIKNASNRFLAAESLRQLQRMPVEELSQGMSTARAKTLREGGFCNVADVYSATVYNLASLRSITEDTARSLKEGAKQCAENVQATVRIHLSADDKNDESTSLICAVYIYRQQVQELAALDELMQAQGARIEKALKSLETVGNGAEWPFLEREEKQVIGEAYCLLNNSAEGEYAHTIQKVRQRIRMMQSPNSYVAWADFSENSIAYFNVLEALVPGAIGNSDAHFGLSEELARAIQEECFFPDGLKCELRRYQEWGVKYILHQERVLLGDEMGLGKTIQAIAAMVSLRNTGATHFLVICPASVIPNWCKEIADKSKLHVTKVHGGDREKAFEDWIAHGGAAVTNFETTAHLKLDRAFRYSLLIVDEAHYIKNIEAVRTKNVARLGWYAERILFMTGTALENRVDEMIALIRLLRPSLATRLRNLSALPSAPRFREMIAPVYYRRKREDVLTELPELVESEEWCTLSSRETAVYESSVLNRNFMSARRVSWNVDDPAYSSKAKRMKELVEMAREDGRKIIVFSFFLETIRSVCAILGESCTAPIDGSTPVQKRQEIIDEFGNKPEKTVLPAQIQSGGTGLNIQAASVVILCEPQLKPSIELQAISRAYRMGQARNVLVYRLLCEGTIDERIMEMLEEKQAVFDAFADPSVAAAATAREEVAIDDKTMGKIIELEIARINAKRAAGRAQAEKVI